MYIYVCVCVNYSAIITEVILSDFVKSETI